MIEQCAATGKAEFESNGNGNSDNYIGGLVGQNNGNIDSCYNKITDIDCYGTDTTKLQVLYVYWNIRR